MSGGEIIEIEYQLTVDDLARFSAENQSSLLSRQSFLSRFVFITINMLVGIVITLLIILAINVVFDGDSFLELLPGLLNFLMFPFLWIILLISIVIYSVYPRISMPKHSTKILTKNFYQLGKNRIILSRKTIFINQQGFREKSDFHTSFYEWAGVEKVDILDGDLCLFLSALSAVLVPSRFFKSEEEKQRIYEQCVIWWSAAQEKAA